MTTIGIVLVLITALLTGLVVASWYGKQNGKPVAAISRGPVHYHHSHTVASGSSRTSEVLTDALIGGAVGAGVGAAAGAIADGGKGAGKGAAIGGLVGATAGTIHGLDRTQDR